MIKTPISDKLIAARSRRDVTQLLASVGLGLAALPLVGSRAKAEVKLDVFTWAGYDVPELVPQYVAKHGGPPTFSLFATEEEALQKMLAGYDVDVMHPCSYNIKRWKDAGILQPIDTTRIAEYDNLWERFRTIPETSFDGQAYFVPFDAGTASIVYRADLIDPADVADPSWKILFDEKYKGKLSMYDTDTTFIEIVSKIMGFDNYLSLTDEQLEAIKPMLQKQRELMKFYWSDQTQMEQAIAAGELVAAYAWSGSYATLKGQGIDVGYMVPKEGILGYCCGLVRHARAPGDEQAAYDFMNAMLDPEVGKHLVSALGYFHSNKKTYDLIDPAVLATFGLADPAATFAALTIEPEPEEPYRSRYIALVNEIKAGI